MTIPNWINLDITNRCTLQCPQCLRTWYYKKRPPGKDMTVEQFKQVLDYFYGVLFCGQVSDPIYHPKFIEFLNMSSNKFVKVNTAASHRSWAWYEEAFGVNRNAVWRFGIDGLPKDSHKHRVNQDGEKLFDIMLMAKEMGLAVEWQVLTFNYVIPHLENIKQLANRHNLKLVLEEPRDRAID